MKFQLVFFRIKRCGFFKPFDPLPAFGNAQACFEDLELWLDKKPLGETKTFEAGMEASTHPAYCFDLQRDKATMDVFITLWNEVHHSRGQLPTVNGNATVGQAQVSPVSLKKGDIPGYPSYFWVLPGKDLYAAIIPENSIGTGNGNFRRYMESFLEKFSRCAVLGEDAEHEHVVIGYASDRAKAVEDVAPHFEISFCQSPGDIDFLRENASRVRKVIRCEKVLLGVTDDQEVVQTLLRFIPGFANAQPSAPTYKLKYELSCRLDHRELETIIQRSTGALVGGPTGDVGFQLDNDHRTYWLGRTIVKADRDWKAEVEGSIVTPSSLFNCIRKERHTLLGLIPTYAARAKVKPRRRLVKT